jgi:hypothetical protein
MTFAPTDAQAGTATRWRAGEKSRRSGGELTGARGALTVVTLVQALSERARPELSEKDRYRLRSLEYSLRDADDTPPRAEAAADDSY